MLDRTEIWREDKVKERRVEERRENQRTTVGEEVTHVRLNGAIVTRLNCCFVLSAMC